MYEKFAELLAKTIKQHIGCQKIQVFLRMFFLTGKQEKASQKRTNSKYWLTTLA